MLIDLKCEQSYMDGMFLNNGYIAYLLYPFRPHPILHFSHSLPPLRNPQNIYGWPWQMLNANWVLINLTWTFAQFIYWCVTTCMLQTCSNTSIANTQGSVPLAWHEEDSKVQFCGCDLTVWPTLKHAHCGILTQLWRSAVSSVWQRVNGKGHEAIGCTDSSMFCWLLMDWMGTAALTPRVTIKHWWEAKCSLPFPHEEKEKCVSARDKPQTRPCAYCSETENILWW